MKPLIILEMGSNHSGSLSHGEAIISAYAEICREHAEMYDFVFKLQYRNFDTFIRRDMADDHTVPLIKKLAQIRLTASECKSLVDTCRRHGFGTMVTPFDEPSVDCLLSHNVDYIKVASSSFSDWPLLAAIANAAKPVVASCAGASEEELDDVVAFFGDHKINLILQHCISNYPTDATDMHLGQISYLRHRYPHLDIGFSSHEEPNTIDIAPLALALGARSFEKHVALATESIPKNRHSTSPIEFAAWLHQLSRSAKILGKSDRRYQASEDELATLQSLRRGVFLKHQIKGDAIIYRDDIYFAAPPSPGQITANDLHQGHQLRANKNLSPDAPLLWSDVHQTNRRQRLARQAATLAPPGSA